jgi:predicted membrane protein
MNYSKDYDNWRDERRTRRMARFSHGGIYAGHGAPHGHIVLGSIVLLLGILFLLENLGIFYVADLWQFWPVILIGVGTARLLDARGLQSKFPGIIIAAVGFIFLMHNLGYIPWELAHLLWPFLLICFGAFLLLRGFGSRGHWAGPHSFVDDASTISDNVLKEDVVFGGINRKIESQDFQGGQATAVFGGIEVDLRGAATTKDEIYIEANTVFGGVELKVPDSWDVTVRGAGVLGGYEDRTHPAPATSGVKRPRLVVRGSAVFGGVTVRN